ncbi:hypothetical protein RBSH_04925 [Rhodopirellula baltica SH28]|uniref:Uncharacterized protein n=1 Tax=Rhodopirellula baltica SH28 TaxID=993517 RepID=K5D067_RHOBT|nr:hypothetical protein [Rhodopirellula baltica]EKJ99841.1 hypothetical protein RBSH_04925 [Rhodopirellula baltica SH28]
MLDRQVFFRQLPHRLSILSGTIALSFVLGTSSNLSAENWTSLVGNRTIQAQMVGLWDDNVILLMSNGKRVSVPMKSLIAESRIQAEEIATRLKEQREMLSEELRQVADAEAAAAPDPLPTPPAPAAYQPLAPNLSIDEAIQQIHTQLREGHLAIAIDALPPSYRSDIDELTDLALQKADANSLNEGVRELHRWADLIVTRQNWIKSHPRVAAGSPDSDSPYVEVIDEMILPIANMIRAGFADGAGDAETIRQKGVTNWIRERSEAMAPYFRQLTQSFTSSDPRWEVARFDEKTATIKRAGSGTQQPGQRRPSRGETIDFVQVEGYWIPKSVADQFPKWVEEQRKQISEMNAAEVSGLTIPQAGPAAAMASGMAAQMSQNLAALEAAADATAFHETSEQMLAPLQPFLSMAGAAMKMGGGRNANGMSGYGDSGYGMGDSGYEDMGMDPLYDETMMEDGSMDQSGSNYGMESMNQ